MRPLSVQIAEAFRAAAEELGAVGETFDGQSDSTAQLNGLNQLIAKNFNGISLEAVDGGSIRGLARIAEQNQVYLNHVWNSATWFTPWDASDYYSLHIQPNEFEGFGQVTRVLLEALVEKAPSYASAALSTTRRYCSKCRRRCDHRRVPRHHARRRIARRLGT